MELRQLVILALQVSILCTVFGFGLRATTGDLLYLARRPGLMLRSLLAMLVVMPLVALGLSLPSTSSTQPRSPWSPWRSPRCRHCCRTGRARLAVIALTAWR
jgi:hypothetical protein